MRRTLVIIAALTAVRIGYAAPGAASGPITVDSTTFVPGSSVMGTDGGVYSDTIPPLASTTTAAFRMTKYRAQHVNLRDALGTEIGTSGNPLYTTASSTITIASVTITNTALSVSGSTVTVAQPTAANLNATVLQSNGANLRASVSINGSSNTVQAVQSGAWSLTPVGTSTVTFNGTAQPVTVSNTPSVTVGSALPAGTNNIGTVSGSSVTIPGTVNTRTVTVSSVIVTSMPPVTVSLSTVTITNSTFSIVGISSVNVVNQPTVTIGSALPVGNNKIGTVSGSTVTITNTSFGITGTPNVNVLSTPASYQNNPALLKASVSINGSSNSVTAAQSGTWTDTVTQGTPASLRSSVYIAGSSNTVQAAQSGSWAVNSTVVNTSTVTFANIAQPVTQTNPLLLRSSVFIDGSSNTVAAAQSGSWTNTVTQGTNANLRASVDIDASSNTVVLGAGSANVGKVAYQTPTTGALTPAVISFSSTGDNVVVSTQSAQTVRIFRILFTASTATTFTFKSGGATSLSGTMTLNAGASVVLDFSGEPWYVTTSGQAFIINQTGTAQVSGTVWYTQS